MQNNLISSDLERYNIVKNIVEENDCFLLTSFEEFEERRNTVLNKSYNFVRIDIIASCYHQSSVVFTNLKLRKTGTRCKDCIKKYNRTVVNRSNVNITEYEGVTFINKFLTPYYEVIRMKEGCKADIAIRSFECSDNKWIPIQIKTTNGKIHSMYSFNIRNEYDNMLIICTSIKDQKIWVIPYNEIKGIQKINISERSKYNIYFINDNKNINLVINNYLDKIIKDKLEVFNTPINTYQQREQEYIFKRETFIDFLEYKYPYIQGTCVDFNINNKKVQEKVAGYHNKLNKYYLKSGLSHNGGTENKIRNIIPYNIGDNDYYWFHSSIDDRFWIIPESVLICKKYIGNPLYITKKFINFDTMDWVKSYEYNYKKIDDKQKESIKKLFL